MRSISRRPAVRPLLEPVLPTLRRARLILERPHFARALRAHLTRTVGRRDQRFSAYFDYVIRTIERGEDALALISRHRAVSDVRMLDVGSAYGGFPIAFARSGAREAVGIEPDVELVRLSGQLLRDFPCGMRMIHGSALDETLMASLGTFDVVTCNDVIEHVPEPRKLIQILARAVQPGGLLYLSMPNARAVSNVRCDPHYRIFGLTLFSHEEAKRYFAAVGFTERYDVEEFYCLAEYLAWLGDEGLQTELADPMMTIPTEDELVRDVRGLRDQAGQMYSDLSATWRERLEVAIGQYVSEFERALITHSSTLLYEYGFGVWPIIAEKPAN
jgi:2-polyprenyl-3-methyl-5-hydroxy-6-metoxy-1,4-benzoquinol methylase